MVSQTYNSSTWEAKAREFLVEGLHSLVSAMRPCLKISKSATRDRGQASLAGEMAR